jgi:hypothetical protein
MAESHVCMSCGLDLARIRAVVEPRYGLPVVACPDCRTVVMRRMDPMVAQWRRTMRVFAAVRAMLVRVVAAVVLMSASVGVVLLLEAEANARGRRLFDLPVLLRRNQLGFSGDDWLGVWLFLASWIGVQAGVGVLLSVGFGHWRPRIFAWGGWAATLVLFLSWPAVVHPFVAATGWALRDPVAYDGPVGGVLVMRATVGLGAMLAAPLGVPLGGGLVWAGAHWRQMKFRARRRRRRMDRGFGG